MIIVIKILMLLLGFWLSYKATDTIKRLGWKKIPRNFRIGYILIYVLTLSFILIAILA